MAERSAIFNREKTWGEGKVFRTNELFNNKETVAAFPCQWKRVKKQNKFVTFALKLPGLTEKILFTE